MIGSSRARRQLQKMVMGLPVWTATRLDWYVGLARVNDVRRVVVSARLVRLALAYVPHSYRGSWRGLCARALPHCVHACSPLAQSEEERKIGAHVHRAS